MVLRIYGLTKDSHTASDLTSFTAVRLYTGLASTFDFVAVTPLVVA